MERRWTGARPPIEELACSEINGSVLGLFSVTEAAPASTEQWQIGCRKFAIGVDDVDQAVAYLKTRGVTISQEPIAVGTLKVAGIKDPDGLIIELIQRG